MTDGVQTSELVTPPITRELITQEIADNGGVLYLNNFGFRLCNTSYSFDSPQEDLLPGYYRTLCEANNELDKTRRQIVLEQEHEDAEQRKEFGLPPKPSKIGEYSSRYLDQTPREFFKTIDSLTKELGLEREINEVQKELAHELPETHEWERLNALVQELYIRMRLMGYYHKELCL